MSRRTRRRKPSPASRLSAPGSPPGLLHVHPFAVETRVSWIAYGPSSVQEATGFDPSGLKRLLEEFPVVWVRVEGLRDTALLQKIGQLFRLHPLTLEDVVNIHQRPKLEEFPEYLFVVTRTPCDWTDEEGDPSPGTEQHGLVLGKNFVVSFHERAWPTSEPICHRLKEGAGRIRGAGPDYLLYSLLDASLDSFFPPLESLGQSIDDLEDIVLEHPNPAILRHIHSLKRRLVTFRRAVWPMREVFGAILRSPLDFIRDENKLFFRDCEDHAFQIMELVEMYREFGTELTELYLSTTGNRLNEIMKVLTVIATIFIPLTFVVGVYGMNFETSVSPWNMPELRWYYGYPACLTAMASIAIGLLVYFRRKGWIGRASERLPVAPPTAPRRSEPSTDGP